MGFADPVLVDAAVRWREDGYVVLAGFLAGDELDAAVHDLPTVYPTAERYHAGGGDGRFEGDPFAGLRRFPFPTPALSRLAVHPRLIDLAEALFGHADLRMYLAELWAKYTGAADYEQAHHRDFLNHTPLVPVGEPTGGALEVFVLLSGVDEAHGPTRIVPLGRTRHLPVLPAARPRRDDPDLYDAEVAVCGPPGTVLAYTSATFHRGSAMTAPGGARFTLHVNLRPAHAEWYGRQGWGQQADEPGWDGFFETASPRQLALFGVPPPGHPFWTPEAVAAMALRYPGLDLDPWRP